MSSLLWECAWSSAGAQAGACARAGAGVCLLQHSFRCLSATITVGVFQRLSGLLQGISRGRCPRALGAAPPAFGKPCPSLLFYLDLPSPGTDGRREQLHKAPQKHTINNGRIKKRDLICNGWEQVPDAKATKDSHCSSWLLLLWHLDTINTGRCHWQGKQD